MVVMKEARKQDRGIGRMSRRTAAWLAWSLWAGCVALIAIALLLEFLTGGDIPLPPQERLDPWLTVLTGVLSLAYPTVGALIASRLPANPIGWIFCGVGLLYAAQRFGGAYADYVVRMNSALPGEEYVAWFSYWTELSGPILAGVFVMLLFPDGHLPSRRWRIVAWTAVLGAALAVLWDAFDPGSLSNYTYLDNPFGVDGYIGGFTSDEIFLALTFVGKSLLLTSSIVAFLSLFVRLHHARGDERQQLKWFLYAAVPAGVCFSFVLLSYIIVDFTELVFITPLIPFWDIFDDVSYVAVFALLVVPVFTYIAILRYRLYDIDVVINRTLVYGSLTLMLALVYFGGVTATQALFSALTGDRKLPQLAVVVSTLVIAALFNPLRRRVQAFIDRRFYRRKYDARKTLETFTNQLRDETDLDALGDDLVAVVRETIQPAHASVWLRPSAEADQGTKGRAG
jgi:hypothetical protein